MATLGVALKAKTKVGKQLMGSFNSSAYPPINSVSLSKDTTDGFTYLLAAVARPLPLNAIICLRNAMA